mmetsp:Transcript_26791/g.41003  ORF Transcript_26791/g.41003 Transcript_26791/m.41003 type:complete len:351 (-) Transcript_26791:3453-4505(-)|eukprot:CAMPEP_0194093326 /NCGR_PEP_ID=MMETSP0149-20130528/50013_1 /TAXON_ID=122233 /ORGANISM="Chaetoceros debilis, Strain MM31A-1" /LENGTH=350 /DNA_ID=CAMNT_0038778597 /DNA_START=50 /DNA_END=1102 /DNA_ORIENTATION=+
MFGGYKEAKIKPLLKMAVSRFSMASNKKSALLKQQMAEIAKMLSSDPPKEEKAKIRAEALIRDDGTIEAMEILQLTCELLFERVKLISASKECPADLKSSIATLIWASDRVDIKELSEIRKLLRSKFGKKFDMEAYENKDGICNERVVAKLSVEPPSAYLVLTYLEKIADQKGVNWVSKEKLKAEELAEPMVAPVGYSVQVAQGSGLVPVSISAYPASSNSAEMDPFVMPVIPVAPNNNNHNDANDDVSEIGSTSVASYAAAQPGSSGQSVFRNDNHSSSSAADPGPSPDDDKKGGHNDIPIARVCTMQDDEPDIYIPPAPGAPGSEDENKPPANDDFDDLQARFKNLKR